ncbi:MAG: DUF3616 domain-containing protein [Actinophytocola sp.]|uniref:DUF3616 domain-containing protein n=1 Tax=Actinophytocola sp. TaxID=1872138 RepID=UPI003D6A72DE
MDIERRVSLRFGSEAVESATHTNLSAVRTDGDFLWVAGDETATVERFSLTDTGEYADHVTFDLADVVTLPGEPGDEVDVEGLARHGPYLWAVGSHSSKRKKIKSDHSDTKAASRLARVSKEPGRRVLARLAIADGQPVTETPDGHHSAALGKPGILDLLDDDEHLAPFLAIPGKDNGFDIEGVAVDGRPGRERLFVGLRGPVLRGWAAVLELAPREKDGELSLAPLDGDARYRKHFLDLDGLGVRDLCRHGDDLLILAGPSMALDGPVRVYRWRGAALIDAPEVVHRSELHHELDLPFGTGTDHAEGIAVLPGDELLVVYDSPDPARMPKRGTVLADVVRLPG